MLTSNELVQMYKQERVALYDPLYNDEFPSFEQWRADFQREYDKNHVSVSVDEADRMFDDVVAEATSGGENVNNIEDEENDMKGSSNEVAPVQASVSKVSIKKGGKKAAPKSVAKSKTDLARSIFKQFSRGKTLDRQKIMSVMQEKAGLSPAGANTYYYKFKAEREQLVTMASSANKAGLL